MLASLTPRNGNTAASLDKHNTNSHESLQRATNELERTFHKQDFKKMRVAGQFFLGFIICRLGDDLFIVDQHAADEIHNFEKLQRTTTLNRQPLVIPLALDLTPSEHLIVKSCMPVFEHNGFEFIEGADGKLKLKAVPYSKNVTFGPDDVTELVGMLSADHGLAFDFDEKADNNEAQPTQGTQRTRVDCKITGKGASGSLNIRPSRYAFLPDISTYCFSYLLSSFLRVRAMIASRACRSSIMIGTALSRSQMVRELRNLVCLSSMMPTLPRKRSCECGLNQCYRFRLSWKRPGIALMEGQQ